MLTRGGTDIHKSQYSFYLLFLKRSSTKLHSSFSAFYGVFFKRKKRKKLCTRIIIVCEILTVIHVLSCQQIIFVIIYIHFTIPKQGVLRVLIWQNLNCLILQFFLLTEIPSMYPFYGIFRPESIHGEKPVNVCFLKTSHLPVVFTFLCPAISVVEP